MKRKSLLIMLLMAMFAPLAMYAQQALPYSYGFENNDLTADGWTISGATSSSTGIYSTTSAHSGSYLFRFNYSEQNAYLVSPLLRGTDNGVELSFYYSEYSSSYGDEQFYVGYTTDETITDPSAFTYGSIVTASTSWQEYSNSLPSGTKRIAIKYVYNDAFYLFLDDFSFTTIDPCKAPWNLTSSNVTTTSANLAWEGLQDSYTVRYRVATSMDYTFFEDFENGLDNWTVYTQGEAPQTEGWYTYDPSNGLSWNAHSGSYVASAWSWSSSTAYAADNWLVSPQVRLGGILRFYVYTNQGYPDDYAVMLSTSGNDIRSFDVTLQDMAAAPTTGDWVEVNIDLREYDGREGYIAIHHVYTDGNYLLIDDFGIGTEIAAGSWTTVSTNENATTINGLRAETKYEWQVQGRCDNGSTDWSESAYFTTPSNCAAPTALNSSDITPTSATLGWTGSQESYNVQYRTASVINELLYEGFEDQQTWTTSGLADNSGWYNGLPNTGTYMFGFVTNSAPQYIIFAELNEVEEGSSLTFYHIAYGGDATIMVGSSSTSNDVRQFTWSEEIAVAQSSTYNFYSTEIPAGTKYVAIQVTNVAGNYYFIDDVTVYGPATEPGSWVTVSEVSNPYTLDGLDANTEYEFQVQGINSSCEGGVTDWSVSGYFTTASSNMFIIDGDWNEASNWYSGEVPADGSDVTIAANCNIPAEYLAIAGAITISENGSLTIEDGGQLVHTNDGVVATVKKAINPYTGEKDNYYLISTPVYDQEIYEAYGEDYQLIFPQDVTNMLENEYDLYSFDYAAEDGLEWINFKNESSSFAYMEKNYGYLYANNGEDVTLEFTGVVTPAMTEMNFLTGYYLPFTEDEYEFANWNLYGNPFLCNTYILVYDYTNSEIYSMDHYSMNEDGDEIIQSNEPLAPMQGAFFTSEGASQYALAAVAEAALDKKSFGQSLALNLTQNGKLIDAARIRFGEGMNLQKLQLNPNHTKLYMPVEGNDYAVIYAETQDEMPVSFKAETNGTYTISFNNENVEFGYLHLIDNLTGNDVDLLETPSYSFEAKTTDYAQRFRLVFATGNTTDDNFAFISNGELIVNGEGTLRVFDVLGRSVLTQDVTTANCQLSTANFPAGVYMIQLVNGENTKTQKIVVK